MKRSESDPLERVTSRAWKNSDGLLCYPENPSETISATLQARFLEKNFELDLIFKVAGVPIAWSFDAQRAEVAGDAESVAKGFSIEGSRFFLPLTAGVPAKPMEDSLATSILKLDDVSIELGLQTEDLHEYFLTKGDELSGVLTLERDSNLGDKYPWLATLIDRWPNTMYQPMVAKSGAEMPPEGISALPRSLEASVPKEMRYWEMRGDEARKARDALAASDVFAPGSIARVDGAFCRIVHKFELAEPPTAHEESPDWTLQKVAEVLPDGMGLMEVFSPNKDALAKSGDGVAIYVDAGEAVDGALGMLASSLASHAGHYIVTCVDSQLAREAMFKMGRPFRFKPTGAAASDVVKRIFVTSFGIRTDVEWLDKAEIRCVACKRAAAENEVLWADGRAISNLCKECTKNWQQEGAKTPSGMPREVVRVRSLKQFPSPPAPTRADENDRKRPALYSGQSDDKPDLGKAEWTTAYVNDLPDSAFLYVESGEKDESGKTKPRTLRHFPYKDKEGNIDRPHLTNAIARIPQASIGADKKEELQARARRMLEGLNKSAEFNNPEGGIGPGSPGFLQPSQGTPYKDRRRRRLEVKFAKAEAQKDEQVVYGIVLEPDTVDAQSDVYSAEEVRKSAHRYMQEYQHLGLMHKKLIDGKAQVVESYIAPCNFSMGGQQVKQGSWIMVTKILDAELWKSVKTGELGGYSIGGNANRSPDPTAKGMRSEDYQGIQIKIDRPRGYVQSGRDESGNKWEREYKLDYGYIPRTKGGDSEGLDVFLGPNPKASMSYWAKQTKADGSFDEWKCFLGFDSAQDAHKAYADHIPERFLSGFTAVPVDQMKALLNQEPDGSALPA